MSRRTWASLALVLVMGVWGSAFAITKAALVQTPPLTFALLRFLIASAMLIGLCYPRRQQLFALLQSAWRTLGLMGLTGVTLYYVGYQFGLVYGTATQGALIQATIPAATALIAVILLREQMPGRRIIGIGLSILGVVLVILITPATESAQSPLIGALCMFLSVVVWALYTVFAKRLATADALVVTTASTVIGTVLLSPFALVELQSHSPLVLTLRDWLSVLYLGAMSSAGCYLLYNWSLTQLDASQTANYLNLLPVVAVMIAVLFLGEVLLPLQLLGGAMVLLGVWLTT